MSWTLPNRNLSESRQPRAVDKQGLVDGTELGADGNMEARGRCRGLGGWDRDVADRRSGLACARLRNRRREYRQLRWRLGSLHVLQ